LRPRFEAPADVGITQPAVAAEPPVDDRHPTSLTQHVVLIGYGRVGSVVAEDLLRRKAPFLVIEDAEARIAAAHAAGIEVVVGNAASGKALSLANIAQARALLIAIPNAFEAGQAVEQAHKLNPELQIVARAHADEEITYLRDLGATQVIMGEREIGLGMLEWIGAPGTETASPASPAAPPAQPAAPAPAMTAPRIEPIFEPAPSPLIVPAATPLIEAGAAESAKPKAPPRRRPLAPATTPATPFSADVPEDKA